MMEADEGEPIRGRQARATRARVGSSVPLFSSSSSGSSDGEGNTPDIRPGNIEFPPNLLGHYYVRDPLCETSGMMELPITQKQRVPIAILPSPGSSSKRASSLTPSSVATTRNLDVELGAASPAGSSSHHQQHRYQAPAVANPSASSARSSISRSSRLPPPPGYVSHSCYHLGCSPHCHLAPPSRRRTTSPHSYYFSSERGPRSSCDVGVSPTDGAVHHASDAMVRRAETAEQLRRHLQMLLQQQQQQHQLLQGAFQGPHPLPGFDDLGSLPPSWGQHQRSPAPLPAGMPNAGGAATKNQAVSRRARSDSSGFPNSCGQPLPPLPPHDVQLLSLKKSPAVHNGGGQPLPPLPPFDVQLSLMTPPAAFNTGGQPLPPLPSFDVQLSLTTSPAMPNSGGQPLPSMPPHDVQLLSVLKSSMRPMPDPALALSELAGIAGSASNCVDGVGDGGARAGSGDGVGLRVGSRIGLYDITTILRQDGSIETVLHINSARGSAGGLGDSGSHLAGSPRTPRSASPLSSAGTGSGRSPPLAPSSPLRVPTSSGSGGAGGFKAVPFSVDSELAAGSGAAVGSSRASSGAPSDRAGSGGGAAMPWRLDRTMPQVLEGGGLYGADDQEQQQGQHQSPSWRGPDQADLLLCEEETAASEQQPQLKGPGLRDATNYCLVPNPLFRSYGGAVADRDPDMPDIKSVSPARLADDGASTAPGTRTPSGSTRRPMLLIGRHRARSSSGGASSSCLPVAALPSMVLEGAVAASFDDSGMAASEEDDPKADLFSLPVPSPASLRHMQNSTSSGQLSPTRLLSASQSEGGHSSNGSGAFACSPARRSSTADGMRVLDLTCLQQRLDDQAPPAAAAADPLAHSVEAAPEALLLDLADDSDDMAASALHELPSFSPCMAGGIPDCAPDWDPFPAEPVPLTAAIASEAMAPQLHSPLPTRAALAAAIAASIGFPLPSASTTLVAEPTASIGLPLPPPPATHDAAAAASIGLPLPPAALDADEAIPGLPMAAVLRELPFGARRSSFESDAAAAALEREPHPLAPVILAAATGVQLHGAGMMAMARQMQREGEDMLTVALEARRRSEDMFAAAEEAHVQSMTLIAEAVSVKVHGADMIVQLQGADLMVVAAREHEVGLEGEEEDPHGEEAACEQQEPAEQVAAKAASEAKAAAMSPAACAGAERSDEEALPSVDELLSQDSEEATALTIRRLGSGDMLAVATEAAPPDVATEPSPPPAATAMWSPLELTGAASMAAAGDDLDAAMLDARPAAPPPAFSAGAGAAVVAAAGEASEHQSDAWHGRAALEALVASGQAGLEDGAQQQYLYQQRQEEAAHIIEQDAAWWAQESMREDEAGLLDAAEAVTFTEAGAVEIAAAAVGAMEATADPAVTEIAAVHVGVAVDAAATSAAEAAADGFIETAPSVEAAVSVFAAPAPAADSTLAVESASESIIATPLPVAGAADGVAEPARTVTDSEVLSYSAAELEEFMALALAISAEAMGIRAAEALRGSTAEEEALDYLARARPSDPLPVPQAQAAEAEATSLPTVVAQVVLSRPEAGHSGVLVAGASGILDGAAADTQYQRQQRQQTEQRERELAQKRRQDDQAQQVFQFPVVARTAEGNAAAAREALMAWDVDAGGDGTALLSLQHRPRRPEEGVPAAAAADQSGMQEPTNSPEGAEGAAAAAAAAATPGAPAAVEPPAPATAAPPLPGCRDAEAARHTCAAIAAAAAVTSADAVEAPGAVSAPEPATAAAAAAAVGAASLTSQAPPQQPSPIDAAGGHGKTTSGHGAIRTSAAAAAAAPSSPRTIPNSVRRNARATAKAKAIAAAFAATQVKAAAVPVSPPKSLPALAASTPVEAPASLSVRAASAPATEAGAQPIAGYSRRSQHRAVSSRQPGKGEPLGAPTLETVSNDANLTMERTEGSTSGDGPRGRAPSGTASDAAPPQTLSQQRGLSPVSRAALAGASPEQRLPPFDAIAVPADASGTPVPTSGPAAAVAAACGPFVSVGTVPDPLVALEANTVSDDNSDEEAEDGGRQVSWLTFGSGLLASAALVCASALHLSQQAQPHPQPEHIIQPQQPASVASMRLRVGRASVGRLAGGLLPLNASTCPAPWLLRCVPVEADGGGRRNEVAAVEPAAATAPHDEDDDGGAGVSLAKAAEVGAGPIDMAEAGDGRASGDGEEQMGPAEEEEHRIALASLGAAVALVSHPQYAGTGVPEWLSSDPRVVSAHLEGQLFDGVPPSPSRSNAWSDAQWDEAAETLAMEEEAELEEVELEEAAEAEAAAFEDQLEVAREAWEAEGGALRAAATGADAALRRQAEYATRTAAAAAVGATGNFNVPTAPAARGFADFLPFQPQGVVAPDHAVTEHGRASAVANPAAAAAADPAAATSGQSAPRSTATYLRGAGLCLSAVVAATVTALLWAGRRRRRAPTNPWMAEWKSVWDVGPIPSVRRNQLPPAGPAPGAGLGPIAQPQGSAGADNGIYDAYGAAAAAAGGTAAYAMFGNADPYGYPASAAAPSASAAFGGPAGFFGHHQPTEYDGEYYHHQHQQQQQHPNGDSPASPQRRFNRDVPPNAGLLDCYYLRSNRLVPRGSPGTPQQRSASAGGGGGLFDGGAASGAGPSTGVVVVGGGEGAPAPAAQLDGNVWYHWLRNRTIFCFNQQEMSPEARRLMVDLQQH